MQRIIIGTAGHVDHGKSLLAKTLTGVDPDRLPEEKQREMTIDLGFVFFPIGNNEEVAIIDVPGHERFLKTMIVGANSIRMVLFIIAADEGIMPQTIEHLDILEIMGIEKGTIIITKADKVDDECIEILKNDVKKLVNNTFLENASILTVSSLTNQGIDELKKTLRTVCCNIKPLSHNGIFRCPIDRVFTMKGFGTIVAGTVLSGRIKKSDTIELLPAAKVTRIRNLQVHNEPLEEVFAGQRAAFNLMDLTTDDISKGCELSIPDYLQPTQVLDGYVFLLPKATKSLSNNTTIHLHKGAREVIAKIITLDKKEIKPGDDGFVQFRLERPIVGVRYEPFLIRSHSPLKVIGGGKLLEIYATKKSCRFKKERVEYLAMLQTIKQENLVDLVIRQASSPTASEAELVRLTNLPANIVNSQISNLLENNIIFKLKDKSLIHQAVLDKLKQRCLVSTEKYITANPLKVFISRSELARILRIPHSILLEKAHEELEKEGKIELRAEGIRIKNLEVKISTKAKKILETIEKFAIASGFQPFNRDDINDYLTDEDEGTVKELFDYLVKNEILIQIVNDKYLHKKMLSHAKKILVDFLKREQKIRAPEYRELLDISRDKARLLLDYFFTSGITIRTKGTHRLANM